MVVSRFENNLHKSIRYVLIIAQLFGLFPVQNVLTTDISLLSFSWWSLRVISSILTAFGAYFIVIAHFIYMVLKQGHDQDCIDQIFFYLLNATSCVLLIRTAKEWPIIMGKIKQVDDDLSFYGWPKNLDRHLKILSITLLSLQLIEYFTIQLNRFLISLNSQNSFSGGLDYYFANMSFPYVFSVINYSTKWEGFIIQIISTRMAFTWTFLDLFIVILSCNLASRFRQINNRIQFLNNRKLASEVLWKFVRNDYNRLCNLCYFLDDKISLLILISFMNNFYFLVFQSLNLTEIENLTNSEIIHYILSTILIGLRLILVCLYGGWLHEETKKPLFLLSIAPSYVYNREIDRFLERVRYDTVGFTGKQLFMISKHLLLTITSSIVIYEVVAIQFIEIKSKITNIAEEL